MAETVPDINTMSLLASGAALLVALFKPAVIVSGKMADHDARLRALEDHRQEMVAEIRAAMSEKFSDQEKLLEAHLRPLRSQMDRLEMR